MNETLPEMQTKMCLIYRTYAEKGRGYFPDKVRLKGKNQLEYVINNREIFSF